MNLVRWNDERLDEMNQRVIRTERAVEKIGRFEERLNGTVDQLKTTTQHVEEVSDKLEAAAKEPGKRAQDTQSKIVVALIAAVVGGTFTIIIALASGSIH